MKKLITVFVIVAIYNSVFAQVPQKMSYQCVVRNSAGTLVANQSIGIKISILQGSPTGNIAYQEIFNPNPQTNANGLISIEIGGGIPVIGIFSTVDWTTGPYFLKTETDPAGGTSYTISGTSQLLSVPYALHAGTVASYTETDPLFISHPANGISGADVSDWRAAYGWGSHASAGYVPGTRSLTINGTALDLSANRTWSVGTVTSVGLSLPDIFSLSGSPVTGSGAITATLVFQSPNQVFASANGMFGRPAFRSLVATDIPALDWSKITTGKPTTLAGYGITDAVNTSGNQTIAGNKTFIGTTTVPTPVNATDATTKAYVDNALKELGLIPNNYSGLVSDIEGNTYKTVTIGTQTWMAENLRVARYKNGTAIPLVTDPTAWVGLTTPGYCWYNNDEATNKATYGALYNWYTVITGNLCPTGWHVPTDAEWTTLTTYLGGESVAGGKLREVGTAHWASPNTGATNETGFTALPGGYRYYTGTYLTIGYAGYWWSSTGSSATNAWYRYMYYYNPLVSRDGYGSKESGFSVRCLRDL
jgi:uncharacterized protein (TIGR02145 family)